jgi:GMP synthase (glutamine-hydrolysing)
MTIIQDKPILILDFGSQYTQLIARRVRELSTYCEIYSFDTPESVLKKIDPCGIILSGGPATATQNSHPKAPAWVFSSQLPVLGICYGMQTMAAQLGGKVQSSEVKEFGYAELRLHGHSPLLENLQDRQTSEGNALLDVWMSHGDKVTKLPPDFITICETANTSIAGMANKDKNWYGLQFHPEVTHTTQGLLILQNFVKNICKAKSTWTVQNIIEQSIAEIKKKVGTEEVILGLSGGVDSSVAAALLHKTIGPQLTCVFVDTGLVRLGEVEQVKNSFKNMHLIIVDAKEKFLEALQGITCPEQKRKIIGKCFIEVFEEQAMHMPNIKWLAQGTIYSDVIESAATNTAQASMVIKSHHNVGGLPENLNFKLLEPLRELFKDEVRKLGLELGLNQDLIFRHPFPGPGLGVRILGEIKEEYIHILQQADAIFIEELQKADLYQKVSQAFAVFLPVKSVGVMGDGRRYDFVICLRAVETVDFMTAHWAHLPWDFLGLVSNRIINEVAGVSRVTYDISGKPPATIEWE